MGTKLFNVALISLLLSCNKKEEYVETVSVSASIYHPVAEQTSPKIQTASGLSINKKNPIKHKWMAVSRDLYKCGFIFGKYVHVSGTGYYDGIWIVQDLMNKRWTNKVDFLVGKKDQHNHWDSISVTLIN